MNHHNVNAFFYYLVVIVRYAIPIALIFIGLAKWGCAKSINNIEKQLEGITFALRSALGLYVVTFVPIIVVYSIASYKQHGEAIQGFTMLSFISVFSLIEILTIAILPAFGFVQAYIYHFQWLITEGRKTSSLPRHKLFLRIGIWGTLAVVVFLEVLKRLFMY